MKALILLLIAACAGAIAQEPPLASFTGTVREIRAANLTLARADQDDLAISQRIKREKVKQGDRISVETKLDLYLKPEAVNVRVLGPEKQ
jgi:hypothetical protein